MPAPTTVMGVRGKAAVLGLFAGLAVWAFLAVAMWPVWSMAVPRGDELALLAASRRLDTAWFTEGFSHYFTVYPEWTLPYTEYLRPVANLIYWVFRPGSEVGFRLQLLVVNYGAHALVVALVAALMAGPLRQSAARAGLAALLVAASPAFWSTPMLVQPAFAMEAVACALCLGAVWAGERRLLVPALVCLALATMTKESALPVVAAWAAVALFRRRWAAVGGAISVLLAWLAWRVAAFGGVGSAHALAVPFGPVQEAWAIMSQPGDAALPGSALSLRAVYTLPAVAAITTVLAAAITVIAAMVLAEMRPQRREYLAPGTIGFPLGPFAVAASACYLLATDVHLRYGYILIVLLVLWMLCWPATAARRGSVLLVGVLLPLSAAGIARLELAPLRQEFADASRLMSTLRGLPPAGPPIYWAADHVGAYAGPNRVADLAGLTRPLVKLSSIAHRCPAGQWALVRTEIESLPEGLHVVTRLPACALFVFEGSRLAGAQFDPAGRIRRNAALAYEAPGVDRLSASHPARPAELRLGATMRVDISGPATVVWYDHAKRDWQVFDRAETANPSSTGVKPGP